MVQLAGMVVVPVSCSRLGIGAWVEAFQDFGPQAGDGERFVEQGDFESEE